MTKLEEGCTKRAKCRECKKVKLVNLDNQCFDCWNFKRHIKQMRLLQGIWRSHK